MKDKHGRLCQCEQCKANKKFRKILIKKQNKRIRQEYRNTLKQGIEKEISIDILQYTD